MALVITQSDGARFITLASLDSDWAWTTTFPQHVNGMRVRHIQFVPSDVADVLVLKDGSATGPVIAHCASLNKFPPVYFNGKKIKPFFDVSECTVTDDSKTGAKLIISFGSFDE